MKMRMGVWSVALAGWMAAAPLGVMAAITFEETGKADPDGKGELFSLRLLFNNLSIEGGNQYFSKVTSNNPSIGAFYTREGREFAFSMYGFVGLSTAIDDAQKNPVADSRSYVVEYGADLTYILLNENRVFLSVGIVEHSHLGGIMIDTTLRTYTIIPFVNLMGFGARTRVYPFQEFFFTGYAGASFLSLFSQELQVYETAGPHPRRTSLTSIDVESPFIFLFEISGEYRPVASFSFTGGVRYRILTYRSEDLLQNLVVPKTIITFVPFVGLTFLF